MNMLNYFQGSVEIKVEQGSKERFLNLCHNQQISLWKIQKFDDKFVLNLSVNDYKKLRPIARKTGCRIKILKKSGFPFFLSGFRKRRIFLIGMFLSIVLIYMFSLYIWNIHFEGNVTQSNMELLAYLDSLGVSHGTLKKEIVCEEIENSLRRKYPNILWVSAQMKGTRIIIRLKENTDQDIVMNVEKKETSKGSIVSKTNGKIHSIIVRSGTPLVTEGEEISIGQTLVEGYYEIKNDAQEIIRYEKVDADADIYILTEESYNDQFSAEYVVKSYTNRKRLGCTLLIGKKQFDFQPKHPFQEFDVIKKDYEFRITENFYLPLKIGLIWYREYIPQKQISSEKSLQKAAEQRFLKKYENILRKGVQIIEKDVRIDTNGKLCLVKGKVTLLVPQTYKIPVQIPKTETTASLEGDY